MEIKGIKGMKEEVEEKERKRYALRRLGNRMGKAFLSKSKSFKQSM